MFGDLEIKGDKNSRSKILGISPGYGSLLFNENTNKISNAIFSNLKAPDLKGFTLYGALNFVNSNNTIKKLIYIIYFILANYAAAFFLERFTFLTGLDKRILSLNPDIIALTYVLEPPFITHHFGLFITCNKPWLSKNLMKKVAGNSIIFSGIVDHMAAPIGII